MHKKLTTVNRNVLLIGPSLEGSVTGLAVAFRMLTDGLNERKLPYSVVYLNPEGKVSHPGKFGIHRAFSTLKVISSVWRQLPHVNRVYLTIGSSRFGFFRDALIIWPSSLMSRRLIVHLNGGGYRRFYYQQPTVFKFCIRHTLSRVNDIIVLGELLRSQFDFLLDVNTKTHVVPNGLSHDLEESQLPTKFISSHEPIRLLYLSNMIESKGYLDVLSACRILYEQKVPFHCDFCGDFIRIGAGSSRTPKEAEDYFESKVVEWGLQNAITYHGVVVGERKKAFLMSSHILILPTYYPWEGQPLSIIEAQAFGTPVIATAQAGIPEQVIDEYNGYIVDANAPEKIAAAVIKLHSDPALFATYSTNAHRHFEQNFTRERYLERLIPLVTGSDTMHEDANSESIGR